MYGGGGGNNTSLEKLAIHNLIKNDILTKTHLMLLFF